MKNNSIIYDSKKSKIAPVVKFRASFYDDHTNQFKILYEKEMHIKDIVVSRHLEFVNVQTVIDKSNPGYVREFHNTINDILSIVRQNPHHIASIHVYPNPNHMENCLYIYCMLGQCYIAENNLEEQDLVVCNAADIGFSLGELRLPAEKVNDYIEIDELNDEENKHLQELKDNSSLVGVHKYNEEDDGFGGLMSFLKRQNKAFKKNKNSNSEGSELKINSMNLTDQEKEIFNPKILKVKAGNKNYENELSELIGLDNVKNEITKLKTKLLYRQRQQKRGIYINDAENLHMCFTGNPGTGKTTVARQITGILYNMGYIKENSFVEVNAQNLKGGYSGQTAIITKCVLKSAKNKVLFIDEAYALFDAYDNGFGKEAIAVILKYLEDERDNIVIIFAGYKKEMEFFLRMNEGLKSRINRYIDFKDYSTSELIDILLLMLEKKKLFIKEDALEECFKIFKKESKTPNFANARFVRNFLEQVELEHAYRTSNCANPEEEDTITIDDLKGYHSVK